MTRSPIIRFLLRFHRGESAQVSFLAVAGVVCFVGLLSMVINSDDVITDSVHMQDVADATALSTAAWTARGLNMISFINVLNSKLISTAVLLNALADTLPAVQAVGNIQSGIATACCGVPIIGTACCIYAGILRVQLAVLGPLTTTVRNLAKTLSRCNKTLWTTMTALNTAAKAVKETFTAIGIVESVAMAKANGADFGLVLNGQMVGVGPGGTSSLLSLPVKEAPFKDFCPFVKNGGSGYKMAGYNCGQGPFKLGKERINKTLLIPFTNLFAHPIFAGMSSAHFTQVGCTPDPGQDTEIKVTLKDLAECQKHDEEARWSHMWSRTDPIAEGGFKEEDFVPWRPLKESTGEGSNPFKDQGDLSELENINLSPGAIEPESTFTPGRAYQFLQRGTERKLRTPEVDCNAIVYPTYTRPPAGFESDQNGSISTVCSSASFLTCDRIDRWSEFTFYSSNPHQKNGPKTIGGYFLRMTKRTIDPEEEGGDTTYVYIVETVSMVSAGTTTMDQEEFKTYLEENGENAEPDPENTSACSKKPKPFVLDKGTSEDDAEKFQNKLRFIGVVYRDISNEQPFWSGFYETPPNTIIAYSQAQVYNHLSEDTFTQDWRVRLEQASLLEQALEKLAGGGSIAEEAASALGAINNH